MIGWKTIEIDGFQDVLLMIYDFLKKKPCDWLWQDAHWIERFETQDQKTMIKKRLWFMIYDL